MIMALLYTAMGRGRKGPLEQSEKKPKQNFSLRISEKSLMVLRPMPNKPIRGLTANEIKIAEQMTPQQLVDLLL